MVGIKRCKTLHAKLRQENAAKAKQWFDWAIEKDVLWEEKKFSQFTMQEECKKNCGQQKMRNIAEE
jgi:hypothetical protein